MNKEDITDLIYESIYSRAEELKGLWKNPHGTLTKHICVDNLLPEELVNTIYHGFPTSSSLWIHRKSFREKKKTLAEIDKISEVIRNITYSFQSQKVVELISEITGLSDLCPDPLLYAGGISMMEEGDFLNPHIDNSHNIDRSLYRKLNILYYVTPEWNEEDGGNFELWDEGVENHHEIVSKFNRLVIMETNKSSWHSVNEVKNKNSGRCCVSNYYFGKGPAPYEKNYYHVTSFMGRPEQKMRRVFSRVDNISRQLVASVLKISRGKNQINTSED